MTKRSLFAAALVLASWAAQAEHAVAPEQEGKATAQAELVPVAKREVCMTTAWGDDVVRTDCRESTPTMPAGNPALKGICTIYYGMRTCH